MKSFLLKVKHFFKRNIYPITVSFCTVLILAIVTISAYNSIKGEDKIPNNDNGKVNEEVIKTGGEEGDGKKDQDVAKPTTSTDPIIFDLPFENATIQKQYTDKSLLYDNTTKLWCTHQGIDFGCEEGRKIIAVYSGKVEKIENSMMNGTTVYLKVSDELTVVYKGLSSNVSVKEGDKVEKGALIGTATSFLSEKADGVHLHLELLKNNKLIDPTEYFSFNK